MNYINEQSINCSPPWSYVPSGHAKDESLFEYKKDASGKLICFKRKTPPSTPTPSSTPSVSATPPAPPTPTPSVSSSLPSWFTPELKECFDKYGYESYEGYNNSVIAFFSNNLKYSGEINQIYEDNVCLIKNKSGELFKCAWKCESSELIMASCDDKQIYRSNIDRWEEDEVTVNEMCANSSRTNRPSTWNTDCGDNDEYKKGCKDGIIKRLQRCLNKNKDSELPDLTTDGKWGKKTQKKIEELYPEYKDGVSETEIDEICINVDTTPPKEEEVVEPTTTTTTEPVYKIRKLESRKSEKLLEQKIDIENDELDVADAKNFFRMAAEYGCLPDWFLYNVDKNNNNAPAVYSYPEYKEPFIYGSSKNDSTKKYFFFKDFTAINTLTKESKPWSCEKLQKYVRRPIKSPILDKFGIDYNLEHDDMVIALNNVTNVLQTYINKGAVSNDIMSWNNLLKKYANDTEVKQFNFGNRTDVYAPADEDDLNRQYRPYTTQFKNIVVYMPRRADKISSEGPLQGEETKTCAEYLRDYLAHAILYAAGAEEDIMPDIDKVKSAVMRCANSGSYSNITISESDLFKLGFYTNMSKTPFKKISSQLKWKNIVRFLKGENYSGDYDGRALKPENPYSIGRLNESILTSKIKSTLNEIVLEKRKRVLQEDILKKRVQFLMENTTFKSRKQRREFVINLVKEAFYVESQGYDKKIIKEEFWDVLKGFFGNEGSEAVFTSFKTRMGEWLTSHLSPKKNDGWIGDCIRKTIQDINMRDVHMITDCKFLSKKIANSVVQKLDEKMSNDKLKDEGLYDIVRGGMSDNVKSANFTNHIEGKVSDMICPILESMSNKFDDAFKGMKKRAIGLQ